MTTTNLDLDPSSPQIGLGEEYWASSHDTHTVAALYQIAYRRYRSVLMYSLILCFQSWWTMVSSRTQEVFCIMISRIIRKAKISPFWYRLNGFCFSFFFSLSGYPFLIYTRSIPWGGSTWDRRGTSLFRGGEYLAESLVFSVIEEEEKEDLCMVMYQAREDGKRGGTVGFDKLASHEIWRFHIIGRAVIPIMWNGFKRKRRKDVQFSIRFVDVLCNRSEMVSEQGHLTSLRILDLDYQLTFIDKSSRWGCYVMWFQRQQGAG